MLPCGGMALQKLFYPRSPCGERRCVAFCIISDRPFLSTLSLRRATSDGITLIGNHNFSIHALLAESDNAPRCTRPLLMHFLSTLSLRRATCRQVETKPSLVLFYPRSPCGERQPRVSYGMGYFCFLSTLSLRRATVAVTQCITVMHFSIHALLAESDDCAYHPTE